MPQNLKEFEQRMRHDRAFRQRILAARKAGTLAEILSQEGCQLDLSLLQAHLPRGRTGLRGGYCYCMISPPESHTEIYDY